MRYQPFPKDKTAVVTVRSAGPDGKEAACLTPPEGCASRSHPAGALKSTTLFLFPFHFPKENLDLTTFTVPLFTVNSF